MTKHGLSVEERIRLYCIPEPNSGCWLWEGSLSGQGRPALLVQGKSKRVHRLMYAIHKGPIPEKHEVCHSCDNKYCINPDHLHLGTHLQNMQEASKRKRFPDRRGEKSTRAKLTEAQVASIRADARGCTTVAKEYGVDKSLIWMIQKRKIWTHI